MKNRPDASYWINKLQLTEHIEGGAFRETYRSDINLSRRSLPVLFQGDRSASTCIYFLLTRGQFSAFHRIAADEVWHFYFGDPLLVYEIDHNKNLIVHRLGPDPEKGESFQTIIKACSWFASVPAPESEYTLVGCTVAPGFDFQDFELADRATLISQYPDHADLIESLTH